MSAPVASVLSWPSWLRLEASNGLFVLRTVLAMLLALAIAFRLDLSSPGSAAVTVSIIALPQTGMVLEKSFYRLLGTLLGAIVTLCLLSTLVQQRDLFIVAVAVWIGLCTSASTWFRGFQAYGWLLRGYTTCLIGFPAFMDAGHAFDIAVDRVSIVSVGILSAGFVSAVVLPLRSTSSLVHQVRKSMLDFTTFLDLATRSGALPTLHAAQHRFSEDLSTLEATRAASVFEDPTSRIRSRRLFGFVGAVMIANARLQLLHRQLDSLKARGRNDILTRAEPRLKAFRAALRVKGRLPANARDAAPIAEQLDTLLTNWREICKDDASSNEWLTTCALIEESVQESSRVADSYAGLHSMRRLQHLRAGRPRFHSDALQAVLAGLRAVLVVFITCAFWIESAWPEGFSMTFLAVVGCALLSQAPNPTRAALQMSSGFALGLPALLVCYTWVLPAANGFAMLALGLSPFLIFGGWLMTRPGQMLAGSGYFLFFLTALNLTGIMNYDFMAMFNNILGLLFGIGVATLSLAVIVPPDRAWRPQRARKLLRTSLRMAGDARLAGLQVRFQSRVRDLSIQLRALQPAADRRAADESLGVIVLGAGEAVIRLRELARELPAGLQEQTSRWIREFGTSLALGDSKRLMALSAEVTLGCDTEQPALDPNDRRLLTVALTVLRLAIDDSVGNLLSLPRATDAA